ncbi:MAG: class I SAM-dependent methyltransferase [Gammaproteobacteria bacterium]|nr:class I SAM-dependent methyltransferase [Gammaproteobacteria bacterium]MCP5199447.1 class I SAM-dependent methyltransferase [Gammaproteobacteria bacterium]
MHVERFDAEYYRRYYFSPVTRIAEPEYFEHLADFVAAYLKVLDCPVTRVLDAGCGAGLFHPGLRRAWPEVEIEAFDASPYACAEYGWRHDSLETFDSAETYDLVICHDVLQYLDRPAAEAALAKLSRLTHAALFFSVLTTEDWRRNCDQQRTDSNAHLRSARWYRRRLEPDFRNAGGGLYVRRDAGIVLFALESW